MPQRHHLHKPRNATRRESSEALPTLRSLVEAHAPSITTRRTISAVCCGLACSGGNDAWLLVGSVGGGGGRRARLGSGGSTSTSGGGTVGFGARNIASDITIFLASSPRPRDDTVANVEMMRHSLLSVRRELGLAQSRAVAIFDGTRGKPSVSQGIQRRYAIKIGRFLADVPEVDALVSEEWLHQANSMRCAMAQVPRTPLVFVIQDDTQIGGGGVDTPLVHRLLLHDPNVEYVRFTMWPDCKDERGHMRSSLSPCTAHPSGLLHKSQNWVDRPHFATRQHYDERLFRELPREARVTPEQVLDQRSRADRRDWRLWVYGKRGDMQRDLHWPQLVDGRLVAKEFIPGLVKQGKNVTPTYAHSYLLHAYRGPTQDVGAKQISGRLFRTHNPNAWYAEDGLTKDDE